MALRRYEPDYLGIADRYLQRGQPEDELTAPRPTRQPVEEPAGLRKVTPVERAEWRFQRANRRTGDTEKAFDQGAANVGASVIATRGLVRNLVSPGSGDEDLIRSVRMNERAAAYGPRVQQIEDIENPLDALEYARNVAVQQVPNVATIIAGGGIGGGLARGATAVAARQAASRVAQRAAARLGEEVVSRQTKKRAVDVAARALAGRQRYNTVAERAGQVAAGTVLQSGQMAEAALDDTQIQDPRQRAAMALTGAVVTGAIDALPVSRLMKRLGLSSADDAAKFVAQGPLVQRVAKQAGRQGLEEATTEVVQTVGELATHKWINNNVELLDDDALSQYANAFVGGFVGGAAFGAPAGLRGSTSDDRLFARVRDGLREGFDSLREKLPGLFGQVGEPVDDIQAPPNRGSGARAEAETPRGSGTRASGTRAGAETSRAGAETPRAEAETSRVRDTFDRFLNAERASMEFDELLASLEEKPYDFQEIGNEAVLAGAPAGKFVNPARLAEVRTNFGLTKSQALMAAALPTEPAIQRMASDGTLDVAYRAFTGADVKRFTPEQKRQLVDYVNALPKEQATMFKRTLAFVEALARRGLLERDADGNLSEAYIYDPATAGQFAEASAAAQTDPSELQQLGETEISPQSDPRTIARTVLRAARGTKITQGMPPRDLVMTDGQERRVLQFGAALRAAREADPDAAQSVDAIRDANEKLRAQVALVDSYLREQGWRIDLASVRPSVRFGEGWGLTPALARQLRTDLGEEQGRPRWEQTPLARAARGEEAISPAELELTRERIERERPRAIDDDYGQADRMEIDQLTGDADGIEPPPRVALPGTGPQSGTYTMRREPRTPPAGPSFTELWERELRRSGLREEGGRIVRRNGRPITPEMEATIRRKVERQLTQQGVERLPPNPQAQPYDNARVREAERRGMRDASLDTRGEDAGFADKAALDDERKVERIQTSILEGQERRRNEAAAERNERLAARKFKATPAKRKAQPTERKAQLSDRDVSQREFLESIRNMLHSREEIERFEARLQRVRSPATLVALRDAIMANRDAPFADTALAAVVERSIALREATLAAAARSAEAIRAGKNRFTLVSSNEYVRRVEALRDGLKQLAPQTDVYDLQDVLKLIARITTSERQRAVVDALLQSRAARGVKIRFTYSSKAPNGAYHLGSDTIELDLTDPQPLRISGRSAWYDALSAILHEAVHAATYKGEMARPLMRKELNDLLLHVRTELAKQGVDVDSWYGLSDTQEFLAEAFTNPHLQALLESIPAANTNTFRNAWEQFKNWLARLLGMATDKRAQTALDEVLTFGRVLMQETAQARLDTQTDIYSGAGPSVLNSATLPEEPTDWVVTLKPEDKARLLAAFEAPKIRNQIARALPKDMRHLVYSADAGPYILINTGVAMYLDGKLDLSSKDRGAVRRLWDTISEALRIPNANVYAKQILADIKSGYLQQRGKYYDARKRVLIRNPNDQIGRMAYWAHRWMQRRVQPVYEGLLKNMHSRLRAEGIPAMRELATLISERTGEFRADDQQSYRRRWNRQETRLLNRLAPILSDLTPREERILVRALQRGKLPAKYANDKRYKAKYNAIRKYLDDMYDYMTEAGVELGRVDNFFPVVMDADKVQRQRDLFFELHRAPNLERPIRQRFAKYATEYVRRLEAKPKLSKAERDKLDAMTRYMNDVLDPEKVPIDELIEDLYQMAIFGGREHYVAGVNFADSAHVPSFSSIQPRTSSFIFTHGTPEQRRLFAKFQKTNLTGILVKYTRRAVRRAEWERMGLTDQIQNLFEQARVQGADDRQLQMMQDYLNMEMGVYNDDWNPVIKRILTGIDTVFGSKLAQTDFQKWKGAQAALMTYNNLRLLPLALASSFVDPLAVMVRAGGVRDAFNSYRDALRALRNAGGNDELRKFAELYGYIEREGMGDVLAPLYGGTYDPDSRLGKLNAALFRYNGLESMTRFTRLAALAAGHRFLIRHAFNPNANSARYLRELGLTAKDIRLTKNGKFVVQTPKVQAALRRFVDEATVRPEPGDRPSWHNDPNFDLASQYKGYLYAFYEKVMVRALHELRFGNPAVLVPLMMYLPVTMMGEIARDLLQGDADDKDPEDYLWLAVDRSGLLGPRAGTLSDTATNFEYGNGVLSTLAGPTGRQLADAYDTLTGDEELSDLLLEALPGQALYKKWGD